MHSCDIVYRKIWQGLITKHSIEEAGKDIRYCVAFGAPQKLSSLDWRLVLGGGSGIVTHIFAHNDSKYCDYELMMMHSHSIM